MQLSYKLPSHEELKIKIGNIYVKYDNFSAVSACFVLSPEWESAHVFHDLGTEKEGNCLRLTKYLSWNTIYFHFFN